MFDLFKPVWMIIAILAILLLVMCWLFVIVAQWLYNHRKRYYGQLGRDNEDKRR